MNINKIYQYLKDESGMVLRGGCAIIGMALLFIGLIVALATGEFGFAAGLGLSLVISIIWSIISYGNRKS